MTDRTFYILTSTIAGVTSDTVYVDHDGLPLVLSTLADVQEYAECNLMAFDSVSRRVASL